jgi:hypothetical protein
MFFKNSKIFVILGLFFGFFTSCTVVSVINRTNQNPEYYLASNLSYSSDTDVFSVGSPYVFKLAVYRKLENISFESIKPKIVINGISHDMSMDVIWQNNASLWSYKINEKCVDVGSVPEYGFYYYYTVYYPWPGLFYKLPPQKEPTTGKFHSRVFGAGTFHFTPFPDGYRYGMEPDIIYNERCWETNYECTTPTFKYVNWVQPDTWPFAYDGYEHNLVIRNLSNEKVKLISVGIDSSHYFQLVGINNLPQIIDCGGTYSFKFRYVLGYYKNPIFTVGTYQAHAAISTTIQYPNMSNLTYGGPSIFLDYTVCPSER